MKLIKMVVKVLDVIATIPHVMFLDSWNPEDEDISALCYGLSLLVGCAILCGLGFLVLMFLFGLVYVVYLLPIRSAVVVGVLTLFIMIGWLRKRYN